MIGSHVPVEWGCFFLLDGRRQFENILACTAYQVVRAVEAQHPERQIKIESVSVSLRVVGKCCCGMTIFEGESQYRETPSGIRCSDCLPTFTPRPAGSFAQADAGRR